MRKTGHVLVIGAAGMDYKGWPQHPLQLNTSNPGQVRYTCGGVARNIAENLARLEQAVILLTALGQDHIGQAVFDFCQNCGLQMEYALRPAQGQTGSYVAIQDDRGDLVVAISDNSILQQLDPAYLQQHPALFATARLLVLDLNIAPATLDYALHLAQQIDLPVVVDPTSTIRAAALRPHLDHLCLMAPNAAEAEVLSEQKISAADPQSAIRAARHLVGQGVENVVVTLGAVGAVYASAAAWGHIPAPPATVIDSTGAGDALTAGVIFGLLNGLSLEAALQVGMQAAALTLETPHSVNPTLAPNLLYNARVL